MGIIHTLFCVTSLASLWAFNVDVNRTWVTPKGVPFVLSSLLHQDTSTNQTWLLLTSPRTKRTARLLHRCSLGNDGIHCQSVAASRALPPDLGLTLPEHVHIPKGRHRGVTVVRSHHGVLMCIQMLRRQPYSVISELTGTCSLLAPDLRLRFQLNISVASSFLKGIRTELSGDLLEVNEEVTLSFSVYVKENLLDPSATLDAGDCSRNKRSSRENTARWRRALRAEEEEEVAVAERNEEEDEEEEAGTEIAIVLDGSGSIDREDFQRAKDFISNMMKNLFEKCFECRFALVQYGSVIQTEFDLLDSQDMTATLNKVQNITQVGNVTKTASAMQHVL
ncbi:Integrin alpha-E [Galemys pyrenaicus]|uniref:Integrin alpha-E n=1 Tax=Galemys pyrenaicus TaxID=202257 RepID=A0A8J6A9U1_GALPY|nr:Integrin alpha-E [Galemys pyrenaicus]